MNVNARILIIDDAISTRRIIKLTLKKMGLLDVTEAGDGKEACTLLTNNTYDLIISDWQMPNMTGLELLKYVRGNDTLKAIPFIMVTGQANKNHIITAVKAGVTDYITKPISVESITTKVEKQLCEA